MKKIVLVSAVAVLAMAFAGISVRTMAQTLTADTVSMSAGYVDEVYYAMPDGIAKISPRNDWDIAFRTQQMSSSILTNDGAGVTLWSYPNADTTGWETVDTAGLYTWTPMYNDPADWENGAFSRHALGHPDYGWGVYNAVTHDVVGDSIFIIQLRDGSFKKFRIIKKNSVANMYEFKWADLDGGNPVTTGLSLTLFTDVDFMGFSLPSASIVEYQPPVADWDILFTKYMSVQPDGTPYPVTGVLSNPNVKVKRFAGVPLTYNDWWVGDWDSTRSPIGWDWKEFNMSTFTYDVVDSLVFFVLSQNSDIYKLVFTKFEGTSTGNIMFDYGKVSSLGIGGKDRQMTVTAYPNPASDRVHVYFSGNVTGVAEIILSDLTGKAVRSQRAEVKAGNLEETVIDVTGLPSGIYLAVITNGSEKAVQKIVVSR
jgi:hypothetical protein